MADFSAAYRARSRALVLSCSWMRVSAAVKTVKSSSISACAFGVVGGVVAGEAEAEAAVWIAALRFVIRLNGRDSNSSGRALISSSVVCEIEPS